MTRFERTFPVLVGSTFVAALAAALPAAPSLAAKPQCMGH